MNSITYFPRIATTLEKENRIGITNLAMAARMNHKRCLAFVRMLERHGYVKIVSQGRRKEVILTESGKDYFEKFLSLVLPVTSPIFASR